MLPFPRAVHLFAAALAFSGISAPAQGPSSARVQAIRFWSFGDVTRIAIQTQGYYQLSSDQIDRPPRVFFDLTGIHAPLSAHRGSEIFAVGDHRLRQIRVAEISPGKTRIIFDLEAPVEVVSSQLVNPDRLIVELRPKGTTPPALSASRNVPVPPRRYSDMYSPPAPTYASRPPAPTVPASASGSSRIDTPVLTATVPPPPSSVPASALGSVPVVPTRVPTVVPALKSDNLGDRSLIRVFGLKLGKVVIDAGHGGHDTGTIGPNGLMEKDLVLDVALRLGKLVRQQLGAEVVFTRSDDTFIPLETRTKIANDEKADLFISIHANSSREPSATGVETYFFNLNSDRAGLDLAMRENATSASSISDLEDILHRAVLQTKREESREFAQKIQAALWLSSVKLNSRSRDRGVRQAPFVVLIGATMPSVLAEIGFVSNPHDERLLERGDQRQRIAEALFKGISEYASSLNHVQMARAGSE